MSSQENFVIRTNRKRKYNELQAAEDSEEERLQSRIPVKKPRTLIEDSDQIAKHNMRIDSTNSGSNAIEQPFTFNNKIFDMEAPNTESLTNARPLVNLSQAQIQMNKVEHDFQSSLNSVLSTLYDKKYKSQLGYDSVKDTNSRMNEIDDTPQNREHLKRIRDEDITLADIEQNQDKMKDFDDFQYLVTRLIMQQTQKINSMQKDFHTTLVQIMKQPQRDQWQRDAQIRRQRTGQQNDRTESKKKRKAIKSAVKSPRIQRRDHDHQEQDQQIENQMENNDVSQNGRKSPSSVGSVPSRSQFISHIRHHFESQKGFLEQIAYREYKGENLSGRQSSSSLNGSPQNKSPFVCARTEPPHSKKKNEKQDKPQELKNDSSHQSSMEHPTSGQNSVVEKISNKLQPQQDSISSQINALNCDKEASNNDENDMPSETAHRRSSISRMIGRNSSLYNNDDSVFEQNANKQTENEVDEKPSFFAGRRSY